MSKELYYLADLHSHTSYDITDVEDKKVIKKAYTELRKALTPPTKEDILEELRKNFPDNEVVYLKVNNFSFFAFKIGNRYENVLNHSFRLINTNIITMIGRFYEAQNE